MKGLLVLTLCALAATVAGEYYAQGQVSNSDEVYVIPERFMVWDHMSLYYTIKFPASAEMVHLMMLDAFDGEMPTKCGEGPPMWTLSLEKSHWSCSQSEWDETYGDMIKCDGSVDIMDNTYVEKFFMLVKCEGNGLWGVNYNLMDYGTPVGASTTASAPSIAMLSVAALFTYLRLY